METHNKDNREYIKRKKAYDTLMFEASLHGHSFLTEVYESAARIIDNMDGEIIFDEDSRLKQIAEHYGMETQREQLIEELSELILAAQKCKRYGTREVFDNFCGELADVYIMVQQIIYLISPEVIGDIVNKKLDRQIQRMADDVADDIANNMADTIHQLENQLQVELDNSHCLEIELKEAKRLLKAAVEDIHDVLTSQIKITNYTLCEKCKYYLNCNCKDKCIVSYNLKQWRFADEALKLIGESNDES